MPLSISADVNFIAQSGVAVINGLVILAFIRALCKERGELFSSIIDDAIQGLDLYYTQAT